MDYIENILRKSLRFASRFKAEAAPNPPVGAAIIYNDEVVYGAHKQYGKPHAEVNAIKAALNKFYSYNLRDDDNLLNIDIARKLEGATLVVTLEPCYTYGKQPPCTDAILKSGIKKVYIGSSDPNPKNSAKGVELLRDRGVEVRTGILKDECNSLIEHFIKAHTLHKPYITLKSGASLDGKITDNNKNSKWITSKATKEKVFKLRASHQAILTGINTVLEDDPLLTDRRRGKHFNPARIILDSSLRLPLNSQIVKSASDIRSILYSLQSADEKRAAALMNSGVEVRMLNNLSVDLVLRDMYENLSIIDLMVEAGGKIIGSFFDSNNVDRWELFLAPKVIGGMNSMNVVGGVGVTHLKDIEVAIEVSHNKVEPRNPSSDIHISAIFKKYY